MGVYEDEEALDRPLLLAGGGGGWHGGGGDDEDDQQIIDKELLEVVVTNCKNSAGVLYGANGNDGGLGEGDGGEGEERDDTDWASLDIVRILYFLSGISGSTW